MTLQWFAEVLSAHAVLVVTLPVVAIGGGPVRAEDEALLEEAAASGWVSSRGRRAFECATAGVVLILLFPVLVVCWLLVRLSSRGPVFFRQRRMGRDGQEFELYKFRSMRVSAAWEGPSHTVHADSRITRAGALLRRYKLDELPQFWNVLKGDMSLVGPRPKLAQHESLHMPFRPGVTGAATLAFRHEERMLLEVPPHRLEAFYDYVLKPIKNRIDIDYMERATFLSDLKILCRTFFRCLNSAADARREMEELLREYSRDSLDALSPRQEAPFWQDMPRGAAFMAEFKDEFAGDLDDAFCRGERAEAKSRIAVACSWQSR